LLYRVRRCGRATDEHGEGFLQDAKGLVVGVFHLSADALHARLQAAGRNSPVCWPLRRTEGKQCTQEHMKVVH
jgi:hypothetical protein